MGPELSRICIYVCSTVTFAHLYSILANIFLIKNGTVRGLPPVPWRKYRVRIFGGQAYFSLEIMKWAWALIGKNSTAKSLLFWKFLSRLKFCSIVIYFQKYIFIFEKWTISLEFLIIFFVFSRVS